MPAAKNSSIAQGIAAAVRAAGTPSQPWCEGLIEPGDVGLVIEGLGPVKLPMRPADMRKLGDSVAQAPYGKGTKTIIDKSVRDTLEVDGDRVTLPPEFREAIRRASREIAVTLGLDPAHLRCALYKLLIYPKGGFFLPHRDSEKRKGMVASMIVVLPSKFGGGDLLIHHAGNRKAFRFGEARAQKQPQYVAFFADCKHEVTKVTSGVRVCLAFNLILEPKRPSGKRQSDSNVDSELREQVAGWVRDRSSDPLVFALEHQYTEAGLEPGRLKGADAELHRNVAAVAEAMNCRLYFGQVERHLCQFADDGSFGYGRRGYHRWSGDYEDLTIGEDYQDEITIDAWRDAKGRSADLAPLACESSQLISLQPVGDWVPTRQDYEGYTGNAGNTLDRWYHKSVIAIWPESAHFEIVIQMGLRFAVAELLRRRTALTEYRTDEELEQACDQCQQLAESIIRHWPDRKYERDGSNADSQTWLMQFATELPKFDDPDLIDDFLQRVASQDWRTNLDQLVITSLRRIGVDEILPLLHRLLGFDPPPNQYGIRFLEGLATRDARWLLKLAKDKVHGGLSTEQLHGLISKATEKLARHARQRTGNEYRRSVPPTDGWLVLSQATIAAGSDRLADMLKLVQDCPALFDFRKFQVPSAVNLREFSLKRSGEIPGPLTEWLNQLKRQLEIETSAEPQPPSDFRRPSDTECDCRYCRRLSEFLADPSMKQTRIAAAERIRNHLEQIIYSRKLDASTKTVRTGRPYSLELTKTTQSYKADLERYHSDLKLVSTLK